MDPGVAESVAAILFAAPRLNIKELLVIRDQLTFKYGKQFTGECLQNKNGCINPKVVHNLVVDTVDQSLVTGYINKISEHYGLEYREKIKEYYLGLTLGLRIMIMEFWASI